LSRVYVIAVSWTRRIGWYLNEILSTHEVGECACHGNVGEEEIPGILQRLLTSLARVFLTFAFSETRPTAKICQPENYWLV